MVKQKTAKTFLRNSMVPEPDIQKAPTNSRETQITSVSLKVANSLRENFSGRDAFVFQKAIAKRSAAMR